MEFLQLVVSVVVVAEFMRRFTYTKSLGLCHWQAWPHVGPRTPLAVIQIKISRHSKQLHTPAEERGAAGLACWRTDHGVAVVMCPCLVPRFAVLSVLIATGRAPTPLTGPQQLKLMPG